MSQVTQELIDEFRRARVAGNRAPYTHNEFEQLLRAWEELQRLRAAAVVEPPLRSFADALDDALSVAASTVSNESDLSPRNTRRWADCAHCGGTGEVDDGELTHHEGTNIPFACGPIKCTKDCPKCGGHPW